MVILQPMRKILAILLWITICNDGLQAIEPKQVDIVLAMDLSGSTNGLLINFRERYWEIINEADRFEHPVRLRIGFISYSRPRNGKDNYYVKVVSDLTDDFDALAKEVFEIKTITEAGKQYVGHALSAALRNMSWSKSTDALKMIFAVGNGTAYLGGNEYKKACDRAVNEEVIINAVFCKTYAGKKDIESWKDIATQTGGLYAEIDINKKLPKFPPSLNLGMMGEQNKLFNASFVPYGTIGKSRYQFMEEADEFMLQTSEPAFCERINAKATGQFLEKNHGWDLVDLSLKGKIDWTKLDTNFLPSFLLKMPFEERDKFLAKKWEDRRNSISAIRSIYNSWRRGRDEWMETMKFTEENTLGRVVIKTMNYFAERKGIRRKV